MQYLTLMLHDDVHKKGEVLLARLPELTEKSSYKLFKRCQLSHRQADHDFVFVFKMYYKFLDVFRGPQRNCATKTSSSEIMEDASSLKIMMNYKNVRGDFDQISRLSAISPQLTQPRKRLPVKLCGLPSSAQVRSPAQASDWFIACCARNAPQLCSYNWVSFPKT